MTADRLRYLRQESNAERLDFVEIAEIEAAFDKLPDEKLRDLRENAMVTDMLDEIEANIDELDLLAVCAILNQSQQEIRHVLL